MNYELKDVHIAEIKHGDAIMHNGKIHTVDRSYIKKGFMGKTIYGDSYRLGTIPVKLVVFKNNQIKP
jgi:hypothetical protein